MFEGTYSDFEADVIFYWSLSINLFVQHVYTLQTFCGFLINILLLCLHNY